MLSQHLIDSLFPPDLPEPGALGDAGTRRATCPRAPKSPGSRPARPVSCTSAASTWPPSTWTSPGTPAAATWSGSRTPTRPGSPRARSSSSPRRSRTSRISPDEDDQTGHYGPYVQSGRGRDLPDLRPRAAPPGQGVPVLRDQGRSWRTITARQRAAGALPGYYGKWAIWRDAPEEQVARAAGRRRPVRGPVPVAGRRPGPGELHRRDPRRADPGRQPQRRGDPEEQRQPSRGCRPTISRTPSTTT